MPYFLSFFVLYVARSELCSLISGRRSSAISPISLFLVRRTLAPRDRWNRHNRWPGCLQDKRLYERPREHGWRTILFSSGRFQRCTGLRAYNRVVTVTRLTLQRKHHLEVSRGFFAKNLFHSFLIRWFVDEQWTVFIAVYYGLRQLLAFTFSLRTTQPFKASNGFAFLFRFFSSFLT